ncbi:alpha/beta-hydrolase [Punctularia strigosozonata HHB-11173 SS5]|uniref:alpha/beta-hydrolase n=1 Tax=Punctularia strigosozonata (strain HHB-11173) TaxID=741275 RepID=UPI0004417CD0|nr:alpha/beta-hydrolase [Punctularia strigosozonata HHB-11173 SS5]EIN06312.1 alpha/beta-hydrolase [Punctularia strigosozonata HHB-11173 SS5]
MLPATLLAALMAFGPAAVSAAPLPGFLSSLELRVRHLLERQDANSTTSATALSQLLAKITTSGSSSNGAVNALVSTSDDDDNKATTVALSNDTVNAAFLRSAQFAQVSYCSAAAVLSWTCGTPCDNLPNVDVLQAGGDDEEVPGYFIAHDPDANQIVVAHQGTNSHSIISIANDAAFAQVPLNKTLFPVQWSNDTKVHQGFQETQGRTADGVLSGVQNAIAKTGVKNILVTGHSLGAAIATMDAIMLSQNLDSDVNINTIVFGLPRGGNSNWANLVDKTLAPQFAHISNQHDPVPTVPPQFLEYVHPTGEIHIAAASDEGTPEDIVNCPGTENENCAAGNSILDVDVGNHEGPYFRSDIIMAGNGCPL